jgi:hypothetical protein
MSGNRISFPSAYRIRSLPRLPVPGYIDAESLAVGTALRDSLDDIDQGCLITNIHRHR